MIHFKVPESKPEPKQLRPTGLDVDSAFKNRLRNAYKKTGTQPKCKEDRRVKVSKESIGDLRSQDTIIFSIDKVRFQKKILHIEMLR